MIFVTVGTQLPFDRLIDAMDNLSTELDEHVIAQTLRDHRWPRLKTVPRLSEDAFVTTCRKARCIVGHAGIGTYLAACEHKKPVILMPRRRALGEHRSDHQMDTAEVLTHRDGVQVVHSTEDLRIALRRADRPAEHMPVGYDALLSELAQIAG